MKPNIDTSIVIPVAGEMTQRHRDRAAQVNAFVEQEAPRWRENYLRIVADMLREYTGSSRKLTVMLYPLPYNERATASASESVKAEADARTQRKAIEEVTTFLVSKGYRVNVYDGAATPKLFISWDA